MTCQFWWSLLWKDSLRVVPNFWHFITSQEFQEHRFNVPLPHADTTLFKVSQEESNPALQTTSCMLSFHVYLHISERKLLRIAAKTHPNLELLTLWKFNNKLLDNLSCWHRWYNTSSLSIAHCSVSWLC